MLRIAASRRVPLALGLGAVLLLSGCSGRTIEATGITSDTAQLNSIGSCDFGGCSAFMRWRVVGTTEWTDGPTITDIGVSSNLTWSQVATGLTPGTQYEYQACGKEASFSLFVCTGPDGLTGSTQAFTTLPDTVPPQVTLTQPTPGSVSSSPRPTLSGTAGDMAGDGAVVTANIYSGAGTGGAPLQTLNTARDGASWSTTPTADLTFGTYTARAEQSDGAGNLGQSAAATFTVGTYRGTVLADSPRAYWRLGEASGTTAADQVVSNRGTYQNGPSLGQAGAIGGDPNTAVGFDGADDQVRVNSSATLSPTAELSLEAWVRPTQLPSTATLIRKDLQYLLRITSSGAVILRIWRSGSSSELQTAGGLITTGSFHHLVATYDGSTMRIYVNGVERASTSLSGPLAVSSNSFYIGSSGGFDWLNGRLDEVAVYGKALSPARVAAHYDRARLIDTTPPTVSLKTPAASSVMEATPSFGGIAGTAPGDTDAVTLKVYAGSGTTGSPVQTLNTTRRNSGTFSVLASAPFGSGTYTAQAEQADSSANAGLSEARTFTVNAGADPKLLAAGDIASCSSAGDEATADILDGLGGTVVPLGDTVYENGTAAEFANCYEPSWGRHLSRSRPIVGDHEFGTPGAGPYFDYFGAAAGDPAEGYYSYDVGAWHLVGLNSFCYEAVTCESQMENWLSEDLASNPSTCTAVLYHEPLFSSGNVHGNNPTALPLWEIMYAAGVDIVLSGSEHIYERFAPQTPSGVADPVNGIRQFTVGTGGRSHYGIGTVQPNSKVRNADTFGVLKITLHSSSYGWQFVPEAGKTFTDSNSSSCH